MSAPGTGPPALAKRLGIAALALLLAFAALELALRAGGSVVRARSDRSGGAAVSGAPERFRILCVGDSNTYGLYVERAESFPAQLELAFAEQDATAEVEVINLGVPGSNSAQLLNRLPTYLDRYAPDLLIVLIGVTDHWNPAEMDTLADEAASADTSTREWWWHSRVLRVVTLAIENLRYREAIPKTDPVEIDVEFDEQEFGPTTLRDGELEIQFRHGMRGRTIGKARHEELLERNLARIAALAAKRDIPLVFPTYAADIWHYETANGVIRNALNAVVIEASYARALAQRDPALAELPREELFFQPSQHPSARLYRVYARHLRDQLVARGLVPLKRAARGGS